MELLQFKKNGIDKFSMFLIRCSGVPLQIAQNCYSDYNKFKNIGAAILLTGLLAGVAGGYALSMVFPENLALCIIFGTIWGIAIFNIDMLLVGTYFKSTKFSFSKFLSFSIRVILAAAIGLTISVPLEIKLFETEITNHINDTLTQQAKTQWKSKQDKDLVHYNEIIEQYKNESKEYEIYNRYKGNNIKNGDTLNYKFITGIVYRDDKLRSNRLQELLKQISLYTKKRDSVQNLTYNGDSLKLDINEYGFISRYNYLEQLKEKKEGQNLQNASWLIRFIFVLFEIIPLIIRILLSRSHFDYLMEYELHLRETENLIYKPNRNNNRVNNKQIDI